MLDYVQVTDLLSDEERQIQAAARKLLDKEAGPLIRDAWDSERFPLDLVPKIAELGAFGAHLPREYGCAGVSAAGYGLLMYELERIDSGLRSFASVQGSLSMTAIYLFGSEAQKQELLPRMARAEVLGCFGLTEPNGGSDPGGMLTRARRDGDGYRISGTKMWITNGNIADIAIVWAKDDDGVVRGFVVPTDSDGFTANLVKHKMSLRASITSELVLEDVYVDSDALLPGGNGLSAPLNCLTRARFGIAWGALGALESIYVEALDYAKNRMTFDKPIASRQLVQEKLVRMVSDHSRGLLLAWRLAKLKDADQLKYTHVSLAKRENVRSALNAGRLARDILGGFGITTEYGTIRHMLNLETVDTYEGTHDVHTLILGRDLTGENALV